MTKENKVFYKVKLNGITYLLPSLSLSMRQVVKYEKTHILPSLSLSMRQGKELVMARLWEAGSQKPAR